jgi:hypothetical protein
MRDRERNVLTADNIFYNIPNRKRLAAPVKKKRNLLSTPGYLHARVAHPDA